MMTEHQNPVRRIGDQRDAVADGDATAGNQVRKHLLLGPQTGADDRIIEIHSIVGQSESRREAGDAQSPFRQKPAE